MLYNRSRAQAKVSQPPTCARRERRALGSHASQRQADARDAGRRAVRPLTWTTVESGCRSVQSGRHKRERTVMASRIRLNAIVRSFRFLVPVAAVALLAVGLLA